MQERQKNLLNLIVSEYIKSAEPVGSKFLETKSQLGISSATIRNEMGYLEKAGLIYQPHTSAGRVPTEKGYEIYLAGMPSGNLAQKDQKEIAEFWRKNKSDQPEELIKLLAKKMAELSHNAVMAAFADNHIYYTGLANLFSQPEFASVEMVCNMSQIIDHLDQAVAKVFNQINEPVIKIGSHNPFGSDCSIVLGPWKFKQQQGILGILGPLRMDYQKNMGLISLIQELVN